MKILFGRTIIVVNCWPPGNISDAEGFRSEYLRLANTVIAAVFQTCKKSFWHIEWNATLF